MDDGKAVKRNVPGWYKIAPKHGKRPENRAWANKPGHTRPSLVKKEGGGWGLS